MVNLHTLEKEHIVYLLAKSPAQIKVSPEEIKLVSDVGQNKIVFSAPYQNKEIIATALPRSKDYDLHREYELLNQLHQGAQEIFPQPVFYFETNENEITESIKEDMITLLSMLKLYY